MHGSSVVWKELSLCSVCMHAFLSACKHACIHKITYIGIQNVLTLASLLRIFSSLSGPFTPIQTHGLTLSYYPDAHTVYYVSRLAQWHDAFI